MEKSRSRITRAGRSLALVTTMTCVLGVATGCGSHSSSAAGPGSPTSGSSSSTPEPSSTSSPGHTPTVHVARAVRKATRSSTTSYVHGSLTLLRNPRSKAPNAGPGIAGAALHELLAQRAEYAQSNYRVVGAARVVSQKIISSKAHPPRVVVEACVDNSKVHVVDKNGHRVPGQNAPHRVRNEYTLAQRGGRWVVIRAAFASDPVC